MEKDHLTKDEWLEIIVALRNVFSGSEGAFHITYVRSIALVYAFLAEEYADDSLKEKLAEFLEHFDIYKRIDVYNFVTQKFSKYTKFRNQTIEYFNKMINLLTENQYLGLNKNSLLFVFANNVTELYEETLKVINSIMKENIKNNSGNENISFYYKLTDSLIDSNLIFKNTNMQYFEIAENGFFFSTKDIYDYLARINTLIKLNRFNDAYDELHIAFNLMTNYDHKKNDLMRLFLPLACSLKNEYLIDQLIKKHIEMVTLNLQQGLNWGNSRIYRHFFTWRKPESISDSDWELIKIKTFKYFKQNLTNYFIEPFDLPNFFSLVQIVKDLIYLDDTSNVSNILNQIEIYLANLLQNYFPNELKQRFPEVNAKLDLSNDRKEKFAQLLKNIVQEIDETEINFRAIEFAISNILDIYTITKNDQKLAQYYKINYEITNYYKDVYSLYEYEVPYYDFFLKKYSNMFKTKKDELIALIGLIRGKGLFNINWEINKLLDNEINN